MGSLGATQEGNGAKGMATILATGTANPPNVIRQDDYPDFYFRATKSNHMLHLKQKFQRLCKNSMIEKRHFLYNEDLLMENPNIGTYGASSLNTRQNILIKEVPKLGKEAAMKAINEWGQPLSEITHLIFYTTSCFGNMPGPDYHLAKLLGLKPTVNRHMIFNNGCHAGGAVLRVAKDIVENNAGSRVLVVWVETMVVSFHGPNPNHMDVLVGQALFGDGAAALIIGTDPKPCIECPLFELVLASQTTIPNTESSIDGSIQEMGLVYYLGKEIPIAISENIDKCLINAFSLVGVNRESSVDWNSLFYAIHPGGPSILNRIEEKLGLKKEKLRASRKVLSQYGNMWSLSVIFVLDELRNWSKIEGKSTYGEGKEWGALVGFGPGLSMELVVLRSICFDG